MELCHWTRNIADLLAMICLVHALGLACLFMSTFGDLLHVLLHDFDWRAVQFHSMMDMFLDFSELT